MVVKPTRRLSRSARPSSGDRQRELSGALHEVSNSLTVVLGWLADARGQVPPGALRTALDVAYTHARIGHSVARHAIGAPVAPADSVRSASSLARDAALAVSQEAARKGLTIHVNELAEDGLLRDGESALQILVNLLLNAVAFSPEAGSIELELATVDSQVVFAVADEGPGVPPEMRGRIFEGGESRRGGGAGIGLAYCYGVAAACGAQLRLAASQRGARFELVWPVGEAPSTTLQRAVPQNSLRGLRVLVLEDDPAVTCLLDLGLRGQGVEVVATKDASALMLAASAGSFDAALLDFSPIEAEPRAVFEALWRVQPSLPVLLMSGSSVASEVDSAVTGWIRKPFELGEIYEALRRLPRSA